MELWGTVTDDEPPKRTLRTQGVEWSTPCVLRIMGEEVMQIREGELLRLEIQRDNGSVVNIAVSGIELIELFAPSAICNCCHIVVSPMQLGFPCRKPGCHGTMVAKV